MSCVVDPLHKYFYFAGVWNFNKTVFFNSFSLSAGVRTSVTVSLKKTNTDTHPPTGRHRNDSSPSWNVTECFFVCCLSHHLFKRFPPDGGAFPAALAVSIFCACITCKQRHKFPWRRSATASRVFRFHARCQPIVTILCRCTGSFPLHPMWNFNQTVWFCCWRRDVFFSFVFCSLLC